MTTIAAAPVRTASAKRIGIVGLVAAAAAWVITLPPFLVRKLYHFLVSENAEPSDRFLDPSVFDPKLASNLTLLIQGLIVLLVSTDLIALRVLQSGRGFRVIFRRRAKREEVSA